MKKRYKRPKNLNELSLALSEIFVDVPNGELEKSSAKIMIGAASNLINIAKVHAVQNESAIKSGEIDLMKVEFGQYPEPKKGLSVADAAKKQLS